MGTCLACDIAAIPCIPYYLSDVHLAGWTSEDAREPPIDPGTIGNYRTHYWIVSAALAVRKGENPSTAYDEGYIDRRLRRLSFELFRFFLLVIR